MEHREFNDDNSAQYFRKNSTNFSQTSFAKQIYDDIYLWNNLISSKIYMIDRSHGKLIDFSNSHEVIDMFVLYQFFSIIYKVIK